MCTFYMALSNKMLMTYTQAKCELILKTLLYLEEILGIQNIFKGKGYFFDGSEIIGFKFILTVGTEQDPLHV